MTEGRDAVLGRLRAAYGRGEADEAEAREAVAGRLGRDRPNLVPERGRRDASTRVRDFTDGALAVMADVRELPSITDVPAAVSGYLRDFNLPQRIVAAPEPTLDRCLWASQPLLRVRRGTATEDDTVGVTLAIAGVAETGTLVLASSPERPTLLAFLPETSIVVLPTAWIRGSYEEAWTRARELPGGAPRSLNFVTGPSRTADIAQKLELGAHGPRRLLILLVGGFEA